MTDLSAASSVPSRLGVTIVPDEGDLRARLTPTPATCHGGRIRASAVVYLVDVVAGLASDIDPTMWSFTSDLSVRLPNAGIPAYLDATGHVLRSGQRSVTSGVELTAPDGAPFGYSLVGFARVPRRSGDPEKPNLDDVLAFAAAWESIPVIGEPLREAAGVVVVEPALGVVEMDIREDLLNPAGALQGAMVSLVAESAAEDLSSYHHGTAHVVTDIEIRFLAQVRHGPVHSGASFTGPPGDGSVRVELFDRGNDDRLVASVLARTQPA